MATVLSCLESIGRLGNRPPIDPRVVFVLPANKSSPLQFDHIAHQSVGSVAMDRHSGRIRVKLAAHER
jgi:hypothetical protein